MISSKTAEWQLSCRVMSEDLTKISIQESYRAPCMWGQNCPNTVTSQKITYLIKECVKNISRMTVMWFLKSICNKKDILSYIYPRKWSHEFDFLTLIHTCNKNGTFKREQGRKKHEKTSKGRKKQQTNKQVWGHRAFTASNGMRTRQKLSN